MQLSLPSALAAFLLTGDVFVNAACAPVNRHRPSPSTTPSYVWPSAFFTIPAAASPSSPSSAAPVVPVTTSSSTLATVIVPAVPTTTSSSVAVVVPTTTSSTAAATSSAAAASSLTTDEQDALDTQNSARSDVGAVAMTWDAGLVSDAQTWADHLASLNSPGSLEHDTQSTEGENLYWQSNSDSPYENAAAAWVGEKSSYSGEAIGTGSGFEDYGHYSMLYSFYIAFLPLSQCGDVVLLLTRGMIA